MSDEQKRMLAIVGIVVVLLVAGWFGWRATVAASANGGYKPAPVLSRSDQIKDAEKNVAVVQSNPNLSDQAKAVAIGMIRAHEPGGGAAGPNAGSTAKH